MNHQNLVTGCFLAVVMIAIVVGVGMVSGYSVFAPYISVNPLSDKNAGETVNVTGTTNLPAGTQLQVEIYATSFEQHASDNGEFSGAAGTAEVLSGTGGINVWSMDVDTTGFVPMEYLVNVSAMTGDSQQGNYLSGEPFGTTTFTVHAASASGTSGSTKDSSTTADYGILIDPIPDTIAGTALTVTGKTSVPVGSDLLVRVVPESSDTATFLRDCDNPEISSHIKVVKGDGSDNRFSVTFDTGNLSPKEHIILISTTKDDATGSSSGSKGWTGSSIFNILSGTTQAQGSKSTPYISVDPISEKTTGDLLIVSGTTNLAADTSLGITIGNFAGSGFVNTGTGGVNRYSMPVDTASFKPGTMTVNVTEMTGDPAAGTYAPGSVSGTSTFTLTGTYLGSDTRVDVTPSASDYITVNPIGDRFVGDQFLITGTTSLPVGTSLIWQVMPDTGIAPTGLNMTASGLAGGNGVTKGSGSTNRVSFAADMMNQKPAGNWVVLVGVSKDGEFAVENPIATVYFTLK